MASACSTTSDTFASLSHKMDQPTSSRQLFCSLCNVPLADAQDQRRHLKSETHVYKLRCRVAEPGTVVAPIPEQKPEKDEETESEVTSSESDEAENEDAEDNEFIAGECLFCGNPSDDVDKNLSHMQKAHSFAISYRDCLVVDVETLLWFLHLVIRSYRECIQCGTRRSSVEAVQQHMIGKGHCRFDVGEEMAEFYDMDLIEPVKTSEFTRPDETSLRLPSGKLLSHRSQAQHQTRPSSHRSTSDQTKALPTSSSSTSTAAETSSSAQAGSQTLTRQERRHGTLDVQLSKLSTQDRLGLVHLPASEQRAMLATRKKQLDKTQREERRARLRLERAGNRTMMKHFVADTPGRSNG